jgi:hypothetical protein
MDCRPHDGKLHRMVLPDEQECDSEATAKSQRDFHPGATRPAQSAMVACTTG